MKKRLHFVLGTVLTMMVVPTLTFAGQWKQDSAGWKYQNDDGTYISNAWHQDPDGRWYYLDASGIMLHDQWVEGKYYLDSSGAMLVNSITPDGYTVGEDGARMGETATLSNGYDNVYSEDVYVDYENKALSVKYTVYYNNTYSSDDGTTVYMVKGLSFDKSGSAFIEYAAISGTKSFSVPLTGVLKESNIQYSTKDKDSAELVTSERNLQNQKANFFAIDNKSYLYAFMAFEAKYIDEIVLYVGNPNSIG